MKLNRLETHDRLQHFTKQAFDIGECCQDLINQRPFGEHAFYIFAHPRTDDDGVNKRMIWQPRLTKPMAQTNSMLFKAYPGTDNVKIIWMIPERHLWKNFGRNQLTYNALILESIELFKSNRSLLEQQEKDDYTDAEIAKIYDEIAQQARTKKCAWKVLK